VKKTSNNNNKNGSSSIYLCISIVSSSFNKSFV
jgi:hypothetical protein